MNLIEINNNKVSRSIGKRNLGILDSSLKLKNEISFTYPAMEKARCALKPDRNVDVVEDKRKITFKSKGEISSTGLMIFPGAFVDPVAYAPMARAVAKMGYEVTIVKAHFDFSLLAQNRASAIIKQNNNIKKWVLAGHSLGGVAASHIAKRYSDKIKGLSFWASYPDISLRKVDFQVTSIRGSEDKICPKMICDATGILLPKDAEKIEIPGGNHSYFGYYGDQRGDGKPSVSREHQHKIVFDSTLKMLKD